MIEVKGSIIDDQTRCTHYHSPLDIIAIRFKCCDTYYPCHSCHEEATDHPIEVWPGDEFDKKAILCGICKYEMTISEYLTSHHQCPQCRAPFNPGCGNHHHLYFEVSH